MGLEAKAMMTSYDVFVVTGDVRNAGMVHWGVQLTTEVTRFFFYKHKVHKHTQPQIREILSNLLSTPPASDFEIDNKISEKLLLFPKISEKNAIFSKISK